MTKLQLVLSCLVPGSRGETWETHLDVLSGWPHRIEKAIKIWGNFVEFYEFLLHWTIPAVHFRLTAQISKHQVDFAEKREAERVAKAHRAVARLRRYSLATS